jgi:phenylpropionate dioxygenase-like ring-hydroxylating dioxygenase large terminal subunit
MYQLERRAIFSKTWILISHKSQFTDVGKYVRYEMAGYPFMIVRDRQGNINAFLNVCRHRAFPVVHQDTGTANILSCKYHGTCTNEKKKKTFISVDIFCLGELSDSTLVGWSYGLNGKLAKAPRFDSVDEFDKQEFSLYKVHLHTDEFGFLWVNLDSAQTPTVSWEEQFKEVDSQAGRLNRFNFDDYVYDHTWSLDGDFNWKTLVENYNEVRK